MSAEYIRRIMKLIESVQPEPIEEAIPQDDADGVDPMMFQAARSQVQLIDHILKLVAELGTFTPEEIADRVAAKTYLSPEFVLPAVQHALDANRSTIHSNGDGTYDHIPQPANMTAADHMAKWRSLAAKGVEDPDAQA